MPPSSDEYHALAFRVDMAELEANLRDYLAVLKHSNEAYANAWAHDVELVLKHVVRERCFPPLPE